MGEALGNDGNLYKILPDGAVFDVTPVIVPPPNP